MEDLNTHFTKEEMQINTLKCAQYRQSLGEGKLKPQRDNHSYYGRKTIMTKQKIENPVGREASQEKSVFIQGGRDDEDLDQDSGYQMKRRLQMQSQAPSYK